MKKIIFAALALCCLAAPAFADKPAPPPVKKHHKKVVVVPPVVTPPPVVEVVVVPPPPVVVPPVVVAPPPPVVIVPPPVAKLPPKVCGLKSTCPEESKTFLFSGHFAVGVGAQAPWASGLVGFRLEFPKAYLGLEPFVSVVNGVGVDGMVYAYRGKTVQFYPLAVGFMLNWYYNQEVGGFGSRYLSVQDVERLIDLRVGAGLQIKVACGVKLTVDWRVSIPDPVKLANENGICHQCSVTGKGRALDAGAVVGNAFSQSQLLIGVLFN